MIYLDFCDQAEFTYLMYQHSSIKDNKYQFILSQRKANETLDINKTTISNTILKLKKLEIDGEPFLIQKGTHLLPIYFLIDITKIRAIEL